MYRDGKVIITTEVHNFVIGHAALGDMISSLPALAFARERYPSQLKMRVWLRIQNHLNLSPAEIWKLASGRED